MLARAIDEAKSTDPRKVALALEGMRFPAETGDTWMRKEDHQLMQPLFISTFAKVDGKEVKYDVDKTGYGFRTNLMASAKDTELPTSCKMQRP